MHMFKSFFEYLPKNRYDYVNDLKPEEVVLPPYNPDEYDVDDLSVSSRSDSLNSVFDDGELGDVTARRGSVDTDSSIALSRAMTDSDVDYKEYYGRLKSRNRQNPWADLQAIQDKFPSDYLDSLRSFQSYDTEITKDIDVVLEDWDKWRLSRDEEFRARIERFFDEECSFFGPDDPSLETLTTALDNVDLE